MMLLPETIHTSPDLSMNNLLIVLQSSPKISLSLDVALEKRFVFRS